MERYHIFKLGLAILFYAAYCIRPLMVNGLKIDEPVGGSNIFNDDYVYYQGVQGKPGVDFPVLSRIPRTSFNCRELESGYYADLETDCQVFHICEEGKKISFLCPNGTIFQQSELICEWWFKVNCTNSPNLYEESAEQLREDNARRKAARRVKVNHGAVMRTEEEASVSAVQNGRRYQIDQVAKRVYNGNHNRNGINESNKDNSKKKVITLSANLGVQNSGRRNPQKKPIQVISNQESKEFVSFNGGSKSVSVRGGTGNTRRQESNQRTKNVVNHKKVVNDNEDQLQTQESGRLRLQPDIISSPNGQQDYVSFNGHVSRSESTTRASTTGSSQNYSKNQNLQGSTVSVASNSHEEEYVSFNNAPNNSSQSTTQASTSRGTQRYNSYNSTEKSTKNNKEDYVSFSNSHETSPQSTTPASTSRNTQSYSSNQNTQKSTFSAIKQATVSNNQNQYSSTSVPVGNHMKNVVANGSSSSSTQLHQNHFTNNEKKTTPIYKHEQNKEKVSTPTPFKTTENQDENYSTKSIKSTNIVNSNNAKVSTPTPFSIVVLSDDEKKSNLKKSETSYTVTNRYINVDTQETASSTVTPVKSSSLEGKEGAIKQKSTAPLTRNDLINRPLEQHTESEESQIPQETASFYKNSFNRIEHTFKQSTLNPHPNHKETYEDLKEPKYYTNKISSIISSVTPQYITTQPINNGKPFVGSQVGSMFKTTPNYFTTTERSQLFNVGNTDRTLSISTQTQSTPVTNALPNELFNVGKTDQTIRPVLVPTVSTTVKPSDVSVPVPGSFNDGSGNVKVTATPQPFTTTTKKVIDHATVYGKFVKSSVTTPVPIRSSEILSTANSFNTGTTPKVLLYGKVHASTATPKIDVRFKESSVEISSSSTPSFNNNNGFYVTKNVDTTKTSSLVPTEFSSTTSSSFLLPRKIDGEVVKPRPFQLPPEPDVNYKNRINVESTATAIPTFPTYKISSASPFNLVTEPTPTVPTPRNSVAPNFQNVDSMINALAEMANQDYSGETPRPGLVVPPSAGPQTLHTLAVYFANALDGIAADKEEAEDSETEAPELNLTQLEVEKKKLTALLTKMTMNRYNELFNSHEQQDGDVETTTVNTRFGGDDNDEDNDLEGQHSKNAVQTPKVRQLAKVFTQALSSYLDDPATFRKVLEEVRPTEPPALEKEEPQEPGNDDELLNFSDSDSKSSYPPIFPTIPSVRPTWGYLIRYNTSVDIDGKNSLNPEQENLQGADSQSFVSQFNKLKNEEKLQESTTKSSANEQNLPQNHWTSSPGVTKLWKTTFSFDPAKINQDISTTQSYLTTTTENDAEFSTSPAPILPHHEIKYELRALPQLSLNSTQVHGILIDFMNTTKSDESNRLQRILRKLNTTQDEFLAKMKEIETNPLTRRLILLLISECGANATQNIQTQAVPIHSLLSRTIEKQQNGGEVLETASSIGGFSTRQHLNQDYDNKKSSSNLKEFVDPSLDDSSQDARALQLLNSLYSIASKFGK